MQFIGILKSINIPGLQTNQQCPKEIANSYLAGIYSDFLTTILSLPLIPLEIFI